MKRKLLLGICALFWCCGAWAGEVLIGDREVVLKTLAMEASSEGVEGMSLVAITLINRAIKRNTDLSSEALRRKQYSCWNSQEWARKWLKRHYGVITRTKAEKALEMALIAFKWHPGMCHYHTKAVKPKWAEGKTPVLVYGEHLFYEGIK